MQKNPLDELDRNEWKYITLWAETDKEEPLQALAEKWRVPVRSTSIDHRTSLSTFRDGVHIDLIGPVPKEVRRRLIQTEYQALKTSIAELEQELKTC